MTAKENLRKRELYHSDNKYRKRCIESAKKWKQQNPERAREICRKCYMKNRGDNLEKNRKKTREIKLKVLSHYSRGPPKCSCCGEKHVEFLSIDHINGGGSEHRRKLLKRGIVFYRWLIRNNYPDGFQVLCMNCNFSEGRFGYCPHNKEMEKCI